MTKIYITTRDDKGRMGRTFLLADAPQELRQAAASALGMVQAAPKRPRGRPPLYGPPASLAPRPEGPRRGRPAGYKCSPETLARMREAQQDRRADERAAKAAE